MKIKLARWFILGLVCAAGFNLSACGVFNMEPFVDTTRDEHGNVVILDTPRMWELFRDTFDLNIRLERDGHRPPGGMRSWNDKWLDQIHSLRDGGLENPERYVNHIIEQRRANGLPELVWETERPEQGVR